ncbi:hypothetical protein [Streptomyces sp. NBC_01429]|uniref:hypothetical protein n=1 Tax=Streptomyces sp. NBC_01429 TaxID=2903862 RepID=UPI002E27DE1F|nr:hypothetical protein [Streptomyces sp. NBC_01429]
MSGVRDRLVSAAAHAAGLAPASTPASTPEEPAPPRLAKGHTAEESDVILKTWRTGVRIARRRTAHHRTLRATPGTP